jgi:hypothetical protein
MLSAKEEKTVSQTTIDLIKNKEYEFRDFEVSEKESAVDYPNLTKLFGEYFSADLEDILQAKLTPEMITSSRSFSAKTRSFKKTSLLIQEKRKSFKQAENCLKCDLRKEAKQVTLSSPGKYNVAIILETAGWI